MKLQDLLKDIELGKVYTDKDRKPFKVNEEKLNELEQKHKDFFLMNIHKDIVSLKGQIAYSKDKVNYKGTPDWEKKEFKGVLKDLQKDLKDMIARQKRVKKWEVSPYMGEGKLKEAFGGVDAAPKFSSPEAKKVVDGALRQYAKDLRKLQYRVIKDWMSKAKSGVIDYFDLVRGFRTGDASRAYPYETDFLQSVLQKDKIIDRFRKYFGGKKGKKR